MTAATTIMEMEDARPTDAATFYTDCRSFFDLNKMQFKEIFDVTSELYTVIQFSNPQNVTVFQSPIYLWNN